MQALRKVCISLSAIFIAILLISGEAFAESEKTGVITGSVVNLRAEPNTSSKILDQLKKGTKVSVAGSEGEWYKVSYSDKTGWINDNYIVLRDVAVSSGVVTGSVVNVRSKPDISSEVLTKVKKGDTVEIFEKSGEWMRISIGEERYGWINSEFIKVKNETVSRGDTGGNTGAQIQVSAGTDGDLDLRQRIVTYAKTLLGIKYVYGGSTTKGFDCSGFVSYVFKHFGITLERASKDMGRYGETVKKSDLQPGDLVFFDTNGGLNGINHVGIYIGNSKFIHASSGNGRKVTISSLSDSYYSKTYMRARDYITK